MKKVDDSKLQKWIDEHKVKDTMLWKDAWAKRVCLMRDRIIQAFNDGYEVIGEHLSKSIINPVIKTSYKGVEIVWQYNFYDWQIMVKSPFPIKLDYLSWYNATGDYFYYQGIPEEYQFKKYNYKTNNKEFAIDVDDDILDVWAFALELKRVIDIEWRK